MYHNPTRRWREMWMSATFGGRTTIQHEQQHGNAAKRDGHQCDSPNGRKGAEYRQQRADGNPRAKAILHAVSKPRKFHHVAGSAAQGRRSTLGELCGLSFCESPQVTPRSVSSRAGPATGVFRPSSTLCEPKRPMLSPLRNKSSRPTSPTGRHH